MITGERIEIMRQQLKLSEVWKDDRMLKRVFSWLSRIGAGPRFGSRPISWYQIHQCMCIDILKEAGIETPIVRNGVVKDATIKGPFILVGELYNQADKRSRH